MSLHRLWQFQVGFCATLALGGFTAAALGLAGVWPAAASVTLAVAWLGSAALVFPRHGKPERPSGA